MADAIRFEREKNYRTTGYRNTEKPSAKEFMSATDRSLARGTASEHAAAMKANAAAGASIYVASVREYSPAQMEKAICRWLLLLLMISFRCISSTRSGLCGILQPTFSRRTTTMLRNQNSTQTILDGERDDDQREC